MAQVEQIRVFLAVKEKVEMAAMEAMARMLVLMVQMEAKFL